MTAPHDPYPACLHRSWLENALRAVGHAVTSAARHDPAAATALEQARALVAAQLARATDATPHEEP